MCKRVFLSVSVVFAVFLLVSPASGVEIPVPDAGFEDHDLNNQGDYVYIGDATYTGAWKNDIGPNGAYVDYRYWFSDGDLPARSGEFKAYPSDAETFDYIYQILDETFIEGATYTLSVWVGNAWPDQGYADGWGLYFTGEDYNINLTEVHGLALAADWEQISLAYTATAADAGKKIGIKMSGEEGESYIVFDDVTLSYDVLVYDNSSASSEIVVNTDGLAIGRDWSTGSPTTLTLWFFGDPNNAAAQLYVKIGSTKIEYAGDADALTTATWTQWNVDLTGINLSNVPTLAIGLDRIGGSGGIGIVYIDDIQLYGTAPEIVANVRINGDFEHWSDHLDAGDWTYLTTIQDDPGVAWYAHDTDDASTGSWLLL